MNNFKRFLANKKPGFYVSIVSFVLALICLIAYTARGGNYLSPVNGLAVTFLVLGLVFNCIALVDDFSVLGIFPTVFYAVTVAILINSEMLYVSNVAFGVDGNSFDAGFFTFVVTSILATIVAAVAFSMGISKSNKLLAPSEENN